MPRLPGRNSTQPKVDVANLEVASFIMTHEDRYWARRCCVKGCDHKMGPSIEDIKAGWEPCSNKHLPAFAVDSRKGYDGQADALPVCPCCVEKIVA